MLETILAFLAAEFTTIVGYVSAIVSIISFVYALIKAIKEKRYAAVQDLMIGFITEAENFICKNGQPVDGTVKKEIVLGKLKTACDSFKLKFDAEKWGQKIDEYVDFTLKVNKRA